MGQGLPSKWFPITSQVASRFLAAAMSAWFSLEILNYRAKDDPKSSRQAAQDHRQHVGHLPCLTLQATQVLDSNVSQPSSAILAGETIDLTLLAVTRALDSLVVALYRRSDRSFVLIPSISSILTIVSRYSDTLIFAISSSRVVCLHLGIFLLYRYTKNSETFKFRI